MTVIENIEYFPPWPFTASHFHTMYPTLFRRIDYPEYQRERIDTEDGDFLDIDMLRGTEDKIVILCHGLEGNSQSVYMRGMANIFNRHGWHVAAMNYRGCSGEPNRTMRFYHSGATDDLQIVIKNILNKGFSAITLVGFSLGGNLVLKYLGERKYDIPLQIKAAATFSVPVDLHDASIELAKKKNWIYSKRFLLKLKKKVKAKKVQMPGQIDDFHFLGIINLIHFDEYYTAPLHGFEGAEDYYEKCHSRQWLKNIEVPALLVNSLDDPFLGKRCFPYEEAEQNMNFTFESTKYGGHVGFYLPGEYYWSEQRALNFAEENISS